MRKTPEHYLGDGEITCADALKSMVRYAIDCLQKLEEEVLVKKPEKSHER